MLRRGAGRLPEPRLDVAPTAAVGRSDDIPEISAFIMDDVEDIVGETIDRSSYCETVEGFYVNFRSKSIRHLARINESLQRDLEGAEANISSTLDDYGQALYRLSVKNIDPNAIYEDDDDDDDDDGEVVEDYERRHHHHRQKKKKKKKKSRTWCPQCGGCLQGIATGIFMSASLAIYLIFFK